MSAVGAPETPVVALAALSLHLPQDELCTFLDGCRVALDGASVSARPVGGNEGGRCHISLVVDEWSGLHDLADLATHVDVLSFSQRRRGFGAARVAALQAARGSGASWVVVVDADGQHTPSAVADVVRGMVGSDWDAAIPQRTRIDLRLRDGGALDRVLAERFEAYVVARAAGRAQEAARDLQPGLFVLRPAAVDRLLAATRTRRYEWDLEAAACLLSSPLRLGFPAVETRPQPVTFFVLADCVAIFRYLRRLVGDEQLRDDLRGFFSRDEMGASASADARSLLEQLVAEALEEGWRESGC